MTASIAHVTDGYKLGHGSQYVHDTTMVYANGTPRDSALAMVLPENGTDKIVYFGKQYALKKMIARWEADFFSQPKEVVIRKYARRLKNYLGADHGDRQIEAMSKLHDLQYLPLRIKSLPEGSRVDANVPFFTVASTHDDFYWLTNYVETYLSFTIWPMCNAASISEQYRLTSERWAKVTGAPDGWVDIANHCFAARGHRGEEDAMCSGMAHSLFSVGSDTVFAIDGLEDYYGADSDKELVFCSVNAFEHATATQRIAHFGSEYESVKDVVQNVYPTGIVSYVGDSEDYFRFLAEDMAKLKPYIMDRTTDSNGLCKFVVRPDSSPKTPLEIVCGDKDAPVGSHEYKGSLEILWDEFGGETNNSGFKVICPKVGLLYGEAIDIHMQDKIYSTMAMQGWCVSNVLFGVGSWGFLKNSSRDSYGIAVKGTHSTVGENPLSMQKSPKTGQSFKKSAKGLLRVEREDGKFVLYDQQTPEQEKQGCLETVFCDGALVRDQSLSEIREIVRGKE